MTLTLGPKSTNAPTLESVSDAKVMISHDTIRGASWIMNLPLLAERYDLAETATQKITTLQSTNGVPINMNPLLPVGRSDSACTAMRRIMDLQNINGYPEETPLAATLNTYVCTVERNKQNVSRMQ